MKSTVLSSQVSRHPVMLHSVHSQLWEAGGSSIDNTYMIRAFSVAGPMTWNSLTDSLRDLSLSIDSFRRQLKCTVIFSNVMSKPE